MVKIKLTFFSILFCFVFFFLQSLQVFVNKHLAKLSLEVVDIDSQVFKHFCWSQGTLFKLELWISISGT